MKEKKKTESSKGFGVFSIQGGRLLPRIPTAKYPNRAMMKRIQQRTSVQPLCTAEAERYKMFQERREYNITSLQNESHLLWMGPLKFGSYFLDSPVVKNNKKNREIQHICHCRSRNKDRKQQAVHSRNWAS